MKTQIITTTVVAVAAILALSLNSVQSAKAWDEGGGGGGYGNDAVAPYAYNPYGGVPGPVGGPGTSNWVSNAISSIFNGWTNVGNGGGGGGYGAGYGGIGGCCHPAFFHPWHFAYGPCCPPAPCGCIPQPYAGSGPAPGAYNQEQGTSQNTITNVDNSPGAYVSVYANQQTAQNPP